MDSQVLTRTEGPLVFRYRAGSYAEERLDSVVASYRAALDRITGFLNKPSDSLSNLAVCLWDMPHEHGPDPGTDGASEVDVCVQVTSESPGPPPELTLTPVVCDQLLGPGQPLGRFWTDGLAGYLAVQGGSGEHAEAPARVQKMRDEGQLLALDELIHQRAERHSPVASLVATAFALHLIEWRGESAYLRLLNESREGREDAFRHIYGRPLQVVEGQWLRKLEATQQEAAGSVLDALKALMPYFRVHRVSLSWIMVTILLGLSFDVFTPLALRFLIDNILARRPLGFPVPGIGNAGEQIALGEQVQALMTLFGAMVFMFIINAIARIRQTYLVATVSESMNLDLRRRFFHHLQVLPVTFHARTPATDVSQRFFTDIAYVPAALSIGLVPMVSNGLAMLIFGFTLISINLWLALIALAGLPIFALSYRAGRQTTRELIRERSRRVTEIQQGLFENLAGQRFFRIWNAGRTVMERFENRLQINRELNIRTTLVTQAFARASMLITNAAQVAVLVVGGLVVILSEGRDLSPGGLMAFYVLLLRLYFPAGLFAGATQTLSQASDGLTRVRRVLDQKPEPEPTNPVEIGPLRDALIFRDVQLVQAGGKVQLKGLNAEVRAGSKVAFVGPTGSGKVSLMTLLPRLEDPTGGAILWDGVDLSQTTRESVRGQVTVLSQDTFVMNATLYDNVRLGKPDATEQEVVDAAEKAGLHEFIIGLPGAYDTVVSDRDPTLSTPLRQRLGVARALLRDASVIIMDDALSALDAPEQRELEVVLRTTPEGERTLISVAQRLSTAENADRIYVLDDGLVVESGTHDELLDLQGLYVQLVKDEQGEAAVSGARQAVRRLSKLAPFSSLPPEILEGTAELLLFMERGPGQEIVRQGSLGDELFIIGRGEVEVVVADDDSNERIVATLSEGDYFGEISFLRRTPRMATVRAHTQTELHVLRRLDFDQLLSQLGEATLAHMEETARVRIEDTRAKLAALSA